MWLMANSYKNLLWLALLLASVFALWSSGYRSAQSHYQTEIAQLKQQYAAEKLAAEQQYSAQISSSLQRYEQWVQAASRINQQTAAQMQQIHAAAAQHKQDIPYVLQQDKAGNHCFGIDGLQHYRQSLGYE